MGHQQNIFYLAVWKLDLKHLDIKTYGTWVSVFIIAQIPQIRGASSDGHPEASSLLKTGWGLQV